MALQVSATLKSQQVLMAAVAHDLRTPISVVRFRAEMVQDQELRSKLISTIDEMQGMTSAVLDAVRPEDVGEQPRLVDVSALAESICVDLRDAGKDVAVQSMAADATGICRETQIRRAIRNLIDNALRYGTRARVSVEADADRVRVVIDDDGPGISAAELERVFEPFTRLENSRSKETGGFGLGLPIARLAAKNHGGDVTLENLPGKGLRAVLSLLRD
jgi:signal transduction histidine kinase